MVHTRRLLTLVCALVVAAPVAAAAPWLAYGSYEPDTALDTPALMWQEGPGSSKDRVYFNVYTTWGDAGNNGAFVNPNVGAAQTNIDLAGPIYWEAVFGVWTDCNGDGYIGMAETAIREYSSQVLLDDSLCPPVNGPINNWIAGANNYNGWVTELIPIANAVASNADKKVYKDPEALVWGDPGKPDARVPPPGVQCQGRARGDSQTVGGLLWQLDCQGQGVGVAAGVRVPLTKTINDADAILGLGVGFGEHPPSSESPLNQPTFGSDDSEYSAVYLQDCEGDPIVETGDQPGDDADNIVLLRPVPNDPVGDVDTATVPGTMNYTAESFWTPEGTYEGNCDFEDDDGQDFYGFFEGNVDVPPYNGKDAAWRNFRFQTASRGTLPANFIRSGSTGASTDLGIQFLGVECGPSSCFESGWFGGTDTYLPATVVTRASPDLESPLDSDVGGDVANAPYYTFYAYTGAALQAYGLKAPGGSGVYGGPQCGDSTSGMHAGWNCDAYWWYRRSDGSESPLPGGVGVLAKVGQPYIHRDVDCFDGQVTPGVGVSPAYYGPSPCER